MEIKARLKDSKDVFAASYNFGENLDELVAQVGGDVVYNKAIDSLVIDCQSNMRRIIKAGLEPKKGAAVKSVQEIASEIANWAGQWKPSAVTGIRKSAPEKVQDLIGRMSAEEKAALLKQLTGG